MVSDVGLLVLEHEHTHNILSYLWILLPRKLFPECPTNSNLWCLCLAHKPFSFAFAILAIALVFVVVVPTKIIQWWWRRWWWGRFHPQQRRSLVFLRRSRRSPALGPIKVFQMVRCMQIGSSDGGSWRQLDQNPCRVRIVLAWKNHVNRSYRHGAASSNGAAAAADAAAVNGSRTAIRREHRGGILKRFIRRYRWRDGTYDTWKNKGSLAFLGRDTDDVAAALAGRSCCNFLGGNGFHLPKQVGSQPVIRGSP